MFEYQFFIFTHLKGQHFFEGKLCFCARAACFGTISSVGCWHTTNCCVIPTNGTQVLRSPCEGCWLRHPRGTGCHETRAPADKYFDSYKLICDFPTVFRLAPRPRRSQLRRRAEKGEQDEDYPPSSVASLAVVIDYLMEGV